MKVTIDGIELEHCDTEVVIKVYTRKKTYANFFIICGIFSILMGVVLTSTPACLLFFINGPILFYGANLMFKSNKPMKDELKRRESSMKEKEAINSAKRGESARITKFIVKCSLAVMAIVVALGVIIGLSLNNGSIGSVEHADSCRNCGRKVKLVPGYGYCYNCYEGFIEWQEDNWKD